jgi:hypothetical protein
MNNPLRYEDPRYEGKIGSIISQESANQLHSIQKKDPYRAKFLGKLVTSNVLKLGGKSRKRSNKNKKKYISSSRRRYNKKCRKSAKRN